MNGLRKSVKGHGPKTEAAETKVKINDSRYSFLAQQPSYVPSKGLSQTRRGSYAEVGPKSTLNWQSADLPKET